MALKRTKLDSKKRLIVHTRRMGMDFELTPSHMREVLSEDIVLLRIRINRATRKEILATVRRTAHTIRRCEVKRVVTARPTPATFWGADNGIKYGYCEWPFQKYKSGALRFGCMKFNKADSLVIAKWARGLK